MPGMLTSERIRMRLAPSAAPTRSSASGADWANSISKRRATMELLAEEVGDVGLIVHDEDQRVHATAPARGRTMVN